MSVIRLRAGILPPDIQDLLDADAIDPDSEEVMRHEAWAGSFNTDTARYWEAPEADNTTRVWLTPSGRWVQTSKHRNCYITTGQARDALVAFGRRDAAVEHIDAPQDGPGRPEIGPEVKTRLPEDVITAVDELATRSGLSRAAQLRSIVMDTIALT